MTVRFLEVAEQEYRDAYDYYETVVEHLGEDFKEAVLAAHAHAYKLILARGKR